MNTENAKAQMRKGILEYCILLILMEGDNYATNLIKKLKDAQIIVVEGTLYPILTRLKNTNYLSYRWEESPQGPPRKYYKLTDEGREFLKELDGSFIEMVEAVQQIKQNLNINQ